MRCVIFLLMAGFLAFPPNVKPQDVDKTTPAGPLPWPPAHGTVRMHQDIFGGYMPPGLVPLCQRSNLIIQGQVASVLPARKLGVASVETDVVITVSSVLKGASGAPQIVISQRGGSMGQFTQFPEQYDLMKPGEQYILFLTDDNRQNIPTVPGVPRHWITGAWAGIFRVDGQTLHLPSGSPKMLRDKYNGADVQTALKDITVAAAIP